MTKLLTMGALSILMVLGSVARAAEPIAIGYIGPLTGSVALLGNEALKGATLAAEQINAAGGVLGRPIKIFAADNKCNPAEAVSATRKVITRDRVVAAIGQLCSSATLAAMPIHEQEKVPLVVETSTNPLITVRAGVGGNKWVFRPNLPDDINATVFAKMIVDLGGKTASFLLTNDDWGRGVGASFKEVIEKEGGKVLSLDYYDEGETNFLSVLTKIRGLNPNAMLIAARTASGAVIMKQYTELGMKMAIFNQGDMVNEQFVKLVGKDIAKGILGSESWYPGVDDPLNKKFEADYTARWGYEPIEPSAYGYVGMQLIAEAIRLSQSATSEAIRDGLTRVNLKTIAGQVKFDEHNQAWTWVVVAKITDDGRIVTIKSVQVDRPKGYWEEWEKKTKK
ncbi:MAG TPA: ABC transporter substrate-binding protein [Methylomirabilota bacterium]|jgi:branched-chain amino acid transport system substrate-binding protein|nr:ABC transporter substrate-binding protein [Methylomirabilota bacterium]